MKIRALLIGFYLFVLSGCSAVTTQPVYISQDLIEHPPQTVGVLPIIPLQMSFDYQQSPKAQKSFAWLTKFIANFNLKWRGYKREFLTYTDKNPDPKIFSKILAKDVASVFGDNLSKIPGGMDAYKKGEVNLPTLYRYQPSLRPLIHTAVFTDAGSFNGKTYAARIQDLQQKYFGYPDKEATFAQLRSGLTDLIPGDEGYALAWFVAPAYQYASYGVSAAGKKYFVDAANGTVTIDPGFGAGVQNESDLKAIPPTTMRIWHVIGFLFDLKTKKVVWADEEPIKTKEPTAASIRLAFNDITFSLPRLKDAHRAETYKKAKPY